MRRVGVLGAGGRMGREVCRAVGEAPDMALVAAVDPNAAGEVIGGVAVGSDVRTFGESDVDVVVDFSIATAARENLQECAEMGCSAVVGTTGLSAASQADLGDRFARAGRGLAVVANFAIGAVLLMRFAELAARHMDGVEIIELHHDNKRDAPSGTSLATAAGIARGRMGQAWPADPTTELVVDGARGAESEGVRIHSVRLPGLVAHEEVIFGAQGQSLSIRHDAYDRTSFMPGVLVAVRGVVERPGLTVGLAPFLGFD